MIVKKWIARFRGEDLVVVSHGFEQTPKTLFMQQPTDDQMLSLLDYQMLFDIPQDKLHDTAKEAVHALYLEQTEDITTATFMLDEAKKRIRKIRYFQATSREEMV